MHHQLFDRREEEALKKKTTEELKSITEMLEAGAAVIPYFEMLVVNRACSDPGARVVQNLVLPLVQERIERLAERAAEQKILEAQEELIKAEASH